MTAGDPGELVQDLALLLLRLTKVMPWNRLSVLTFMLNMYNMDEQTHCKKIQLSR